MCYLRAKIYTSCDITNIEGISVSILISIKLTSVIINSYQRVHHMDGGLLVALPAERVRISEDPSVPTEKAELATISSEINFYLEMFISHFNLHLQYFCKFPQGRGQGWAKI